MLPKPKDPRGYTSQEIKDICKVRNIPKAKFDKAFGCNTAIMAEDGTTRFYGCDIERALYTLGHKDGKNYLWD